MPTGPEAFAAYAIASAKDLIPETEDAARQTLNHPMSFEVIGEGLRLFEGWALRDLVNFRKRCRDSFIACFDPFLEAQPLGPSSIWVGCPEVMPTRALRQNRILPRWLTQLLIQNQNDLRLQKFTHPLNMHPKIRRDYAMAFQTHLDCKFCLGVYATKGSSFYTELKNRLTQARDKVIYFLYFSISTRFTSSRYAVIAAFSLLD